jgi:hypothetical protein
MVPVGSIVSDSASFAGFTAAMIAICGFIGQAKPALSRQDDKEVRAAAVVGGLVGLVAAIVSVVIVLGCGNVLSSGG